ncbi:MAG: ABC transporter permease [Dehalococcoidales bacterium]|nr:ABC transporter permease [Dehalococcoidales bacterium]
MVAYIIRRLIQSLIIVIIVSILVFVVMRFMPGDPLLMYLSSERFQQMSDEQLALERHKYGLDKSVPAQYIDWVNGIFHGDLGNSISQRRSVNYLIARRAPVTLYIGVLSFVIGTFLGIVAGVLSAVRRGTRTDFIMTLFANVGITIPAFWLAIVMIYIFGLKLGWLPTHGFTSPFDDFWLSTRQIIMPVICGAIFTIGAVARQARSSMLETLRQDYVRTAWSKGLTERVIIVRHTLKNGLIPIFTLSGMQIGMILGGSVLIETVFNIAGMGRLAVDALFSLDFAVVQAIVLISAIMIVLANLVVDVSYGWIDPRIRLE